MATQSQIRSHLAPTPRWQPAEWSIHRAVWLGWPSARDLWGANLAIARKEVTVFIEAILFPDPSDPLGQITRGERVDLLVRGGEAHAAANAMRDDLLDPMMVRIHDAPIGDVWLRDTGPIFTLSNANELAASAFQFNGWGGRRRLAKDDAIADIIADLAIVRLRRFDDLVAEGGALEVDGEGTIITTRQCLLNKNRNPNLSERDINGVLAAAIGAEKVIWLDEGLAGDQTDGHVDNITRFVAPGVVVCMKPSGADDPNRAVLENTRARLEKATDAKGRRLKVIAIPSPGKVILNGEVAPASHLNFYIANQALIMPTFGALTGDDESAIAALALLKANVPRRHFHAIDGSNLLTGGGSFHRITQQQPAREQS